MTTATITAPPPPAPLAGLELHTLARGDVTSLLAVFDGMGPQSRALRFLAAKPRLTAYDVEQLTAVDGRDHVALAALAAGRPVGIARSSATATTRLRPRSRSRLWTPGRAGGSAGCCSTPWSRARSRPAYGD